jgi:hypothetical protein
MSAELAEVDPSAIVVLRGATWNSIVGLSRAVRGMKALGNSIQVVHAEQGIGIGLVAGLDKTLEGVTTKTVTTCDPDSTDTYLVQS